MKEYRHPAIDDVALESVMHALADPCRLAIVRALRQAGRELACNEFDLAVSKATCSHHFEVLRDAGLIETRIEGTKGLSKIREKELKRRFPGLLQLIDRE
ncbi:MAG: helix-turn-helix domain-containing protein [Verrucomicrobiales bacterium]